MHGGGAGTTVTALAIWNWSEGALGILEVLLSLFCAGIFFDRARLHPALHAMVILIRRTEVLACRYSILALYVLVSIRLLELVGPLSEQVA